MTQDHSAPATKQDVSLLMDMMGHINVKLEEHDQKFDQMEERMEILKVELKEELKEEIGTEVKGHFDLVAEQIKHEFRSANREEIEVLKDRSNNHGKRLTRVERAVGLAA